MTTALKTTKRIQAIDVMRGITMAWMILVNNPGSRNVFAPLRHAAWNGLTPTDLAFPFFMFIMGVSMCFSLRKYEGDRKAANIKIFRRAVLIYVIGVALGCVGKLINGTFTFEGIRILGVLQRLAIVYLFGALLYQYVPKKWHLPLAAVILVVYITILQCFGGYVHSPENIAARIDVKLLGASHIIGENGEGGRFPFEPEGILSTLPCLAHILFGAFVGRLIMNTEDDREKVRRIAVFGAVLLFAGFLLQWLDPINKKLWTSTFVLVTCGSASLLLALLLELLDVNGKGRGLDFFKVFGTNALFAYILSSLMGIPLGRLGIHDFLMRSVLEPAFGLKGGALAYSLLYILLIWIILYPLYKKKIYIRL